MKNESLSINGIPVPVYRFNTVVVGSGAAGLAAADRLFRFGQQSVALVTEGLEWGTSRNTGSDKQTYYKLSLAGADGDSIRETARTLFEGGAMDGDIAMAEAAASARCFFRLVELGVPFPHNAEGEFVGYKTDHDPRRRGTSAGPLTSKYMTECLLASVKETGVAIYNRRQVIEILTADEADGTRRCLGVLVLHIDGRDWPATRYEIFAADNVVYATGGEAGMYAMSAYPQSQTGSTGVAFRAGVRGKNLTESQYGIASVGFRWNLSGTYQQVLPRYVSTDADGNDEREFLDPYFSSPTSLLRAIFLKGYQWPFDPRKIADEGSSLIDILVYHEVVHNGRRVFLDYRRNPACAGEGGQLDPDRLDDEVRSYLEYSGALFGTPLARLVHMNRPAIELYADHNIDLSVEMLEIAVSAQHNNGGLAANGWWESDLRHFFPVGEVNGSHGVYRPGGSALNSGQVGALRAAEYIAHMYRGEPPTVQAIASHCGAQIENTIAIGENAIAATDHPWDLHGVIQEIRLRMSRYGAHIRSRDGVETAIAESERLLQTLRAGLSITGPGHLRQLHQLRDLAVCSHVYLCAIRDYMEAGGESRGSYLVHAPGGAVPAQGLPDLFAYTLDKGDLAEKIQEVAYSPDRCTCTWRPIRPMPEPGEWFETEWARYQKGEIYR